MKKLINASFEPSRGSGTSFALIGRRGNYALRGGYYNWVVHKKRTTPMRCSSFENPAVKFIIPEMLYIGMYEKQCVPDLLYDHSF